MERPSLKENPFVGNTREVEEPEKTEDEDPSLTRQALGFVPGVGTALDVADVAKDVERGDYVGAGIGAAATAVGAVPFVGRFLGKGVKALAQSFRKLPKADETKDVLDSIGVDEKVLDGWRAANKTDDAFKKRLVGRQTELEEIAKKYKDKQTFWCNKLNLQSSNCVYHAELTEDLLWYCENKRLAIDGVSQKVFNLVPLLENHDLLVNYLT